MEDCHTEGPVFIHIFHQDESDSILYSIYHMGYMSVSRAKIFLSYCLLLR